MTPSAMESSPDMTLRANRQFSLKQATKRNLNGSCNKAHATASHGFLDFVDMSQSHNSQKRRAAAAAVISNSPRPPHHPPFISSAKADPASLDLVLTNAQGCIAAGLHVFKRLPVPCGVRFAPCAPPPPPMQSGMARKRSSLQVFDLQ